MIKIPNAALEAGAKELAMNCRCELACDWRDHMDDARSALEAMVSAWEGMWPDRFDGVDTICLPLMENPDDKA